MQLGLIVNPVAGLGGRVGLKGSDSAQIQQRALELGAKPQAQERARLALEVLRPLKEAFEMVTPPGSMGEDIARRCGFTPRVIGTLPPGPTSAEDTCRAAREMLALPVDLLLFAGGDGTARDIYEAVGGQLPTLGVPAGVKVHSAVFANHPRGAGEMAVAFLRGERLRLRESEVVDLDEDAYRRGEVSNRLYGYLKVPYRAGMLQNRKAPTPLSEARQVQAIAEHVIEAMQPGWLYVLGPGSTTRAVAERLGFPKTLVGVDVYTKEAVVALDVGETRLLELLDQKPAKIVVTPIGGQGFIFGRGNQPISPGVLQKAGREQVVIVCTTEKLNALRGAPLLVDTGDPALDQALAGYLPVVVGYRQQVVYRVAA
jgi:predicted polyphosphate/ATP-dependent NAD kinase